MLPAKSRNVAHSLCRSFRTISKNYTAATAPLTEPLEDEIPEKSSRIVGKEVKIEITSLSNGIKVASSDAGGSVSRMSIATNSASRHETPSKLGLSQLMKNAAFTTNNERTSLRTVREAQEVGGSMDCSSSREFQVRNASFLRNKLPAVIENIAPGLTKSIFNSWDVADVKTQTLNETATVIEDNTAVNLELIHKVAYRNGLGNSLYCNDKRLSIFGTEDFQEFAATNFVGNKMTIVGSDVSHDELVRYVKELFGDLPQGKSPNTSPQKYFGGELHKYTDNNLTYASLVTEGVGMFSADLASYIVLQKLLGNGTFMKWGSNTQSSRLGKAAKGVTDGPLSINALNLSYSDSGLFGFNAISSPDAITDVLKAAVGQIRSISKGEVSAEEFERAKTQTKAAVRMLNENKEDHLDDLLKQVAFNGSYSQVMEVVSKIDQVSQDKIVQTAKKMLTGKPSLVVTGNTTVAPYLDELL